MNTQDDDLDPTGMRALLRGLPDPGPMPEDLVHRIHLSLSSLDPLDGEAPDHGEPLGVSRGTLQRNAPSWWVRHGSKAAVAAVVLIGGGALATGQLQGLGSGGGDASNASSDSAVGGQAETQSKSFSDGDLSTATPGTDEQVRGHAVLGAVVVRHSATAYTAAGLRTQVESAASSPATSPLTSEAPAIGPIGTEIGVRSCLAALGLPRESAADVDLGTLDGAPTAVLIVTLGGERTAYAVGRDCTTGNPSLLTGPIALP